jgi:hypothetical protein
MTCYELATLFEQIQKKKRQQPIKVRYTDGDEEGVRKAIAEEYKRLINGIWSPIIEEGRGSFSNYFHFHLSLFILAASSKPNNI